MTPFLEKDNYKIKDYPTLQVYRYGFDFSVSDGDDDYDYENYLSKDNSELMKELIDCCEETTQKKVIPIRPWVICNDRGGGDGYIKILMVFEEDYLKCKEVN